MYAMLMDVLCIARTCWTSCQSGLATYKDVIAESADIASSDDEADGSDSFNKDDVDNVDSLSNYFAKTWEKCWPKLVHVYAIAGWMVSPLPDVYEDSKKNQTGDDRDVIMALFRQLFGHHADGNPRVLDTMVDNFMTEFESFKGKTGKFGRADKLFIWEHAKELKPGQSHTWHKKYSYHDTKWFGRFACQFCSKILGIGSAEWCWGAAKH